MNYEALQPQSL